MDAAFVYAKSGEERLRISRALMGQFAVLPFADASAFIRAAGKAMPEVGVVDDQAGDGIRTAALARKLYGNRMQIVVATHKAPPAGAPVRAVLKPWRDEILLAVAREAARRAETDRTAATALTGLHAAAEHFETQNQPAAGSLNTSTTILGAAASEPHVADLLAQIRDYDPYTASHSVRVALSLVHFAGFLGLSLEDRKALARGGLLHDVGKIAIPRRIIRKAGKLTAKERAAANHHVLASIEILRHVPGLDETARAVAAQHHERLDGTGYPKGLKDGAISHVGRMAAIADAFVALTDERPYKAAMPADDALAFMAAGKTGHLDGELLRLFTLMMRRL